MANPNIKIEEEKKEEEEVVVAPTKPEVPVAEETVTIKKETLDDLMERLKRVEQAADKSRLAKFDEANKGKLIRTYGIRTYNGKIVTSWSNMIENTVEKNPSGKWEENQVVEIFYEDKTSEKIPYIIFDRNKKRIESELVSETKTDDDTILTLKDEDGIEHKINIKFVN